MHVDVFCLNLSASYTTLKNNDTFRNRDVLKNNFCKLKVCRTKHLDPPWTSSLIVQQGQLDQMCVYVTLCCLYYNLLLQCLDNPVYYRILQLQATRENNGL